MDTLHLLIGIAVLALVCAICLAVSGFRTGGRTIPKPPEHLRPKKKCICNDIANHSPGGRCEVCYEKNSMPIYENPPKPPERGIIIKRPECPKDKIENW